MATRFVFRTNCTPQETNAHVNRWFLDSDCGVKLASDYKNLAVDGFHSGYKILTSTQSTQIYNDPVLSSDTTVLYFFLHYPFSSEVVSPPKIKLSLNWAVDQMYPIEIEAGHSLCFGASSATSTAPDFNINTCALESSGADIQYRYVIGYKS